MTRPGSDRRWFGAASRSGRERDDDAHPLMDPFDLHVSLARFARIHLLGFGPEPTGDRDNDRCLLAPHGCDN